jgi:hypothetical protein
MSIDQEGLIPLLLFPGKSQDFCRGKAFLDKASTLRTKFLARMLRPALSPKVTKEG